MRVIKSKRLVNTERELRLVDYGPGRGPRYQVIDVDVITETSDTDGDFHEDQHEAMQSFDMAVAQHELEQEEGNAEDLS